MDAGALVREARLSAGLSRTALAARAGVPTSTVSRIENGSSDPTLTMLSRLINATGRRLSLAVTEQQTNLSIETLPDAYSEDAKSKINWTRLRAFIDHVTAHEDLTAEAIGTPPSRTGNIAFDSLLAGIAEKLADDAGIPRPRWTRSVPAAPAPWETPGTPRRIKEARAHAPEQLASRNIWLATQDLWRVTPPEPHRNSR
ncbi:helix-turn-helix domain-containing protein [Kribbella qitaiheensis]|uniref:helix-turn-helix domain-containing protein n=1 Tax=Kribbella qitaiheensis TaxID=1544730 RepID=UPI00360E1DEE